MSEIKAQVESLDDDFVFEKIQASDSEGEEFEPEEVQEEITEELGADLKKKESPLATLNVKAQSLKRKKERVGNSKRQKLDFTDLDMEVKPKPVLYDNSWTCLLDTLYATQPKPLYVKSHTKIKVLIVCSSALRCLEIIKELKSSMPNVMVAKLFAKHMKVEAQVESLKSTSFLVGVGTASRLAKIIETDPDSLKIKRVEFLLIDGNWRDKKNMTILDLPETHLDLKKLVEMVKETVIGIYSL